VAEVTERSNWAVPKKLRPCYGGPRVRIPFPPAVSLLQTAIETIQRKQRWHPRADAIVVMMVISDLSLSHIAPLSLVTAN
jgi:hypothetical protein